MTRSATSMPVVLLSVRSPHVDRLLDGTKTIEFRRRRWSVPNGARVLLYGSRDHRAIVGSLTVKMTHVGSRTAMWEAHGEESGLTRQEYRDYFSGADIAVAIEVQDVARLPDPLGLTELRRRSPGFLVPQSYRFLQRDELRVALNGERQTLLG